MSYLLDDEGTILVRWFSNLLLKYFEKQELPDFVCFIGNILLWNYYKNNLYYSFMVWLNSLSMDIFSNLQFSVTFFINIH